MITIDNRWKHKGLVKMDLDGIRIPINQLMHCMPEEKTAEEQELYDALEVVKRIINKGKDAV